MYLRPQIEEALKQGMPTSKVARKFHCSTAYVSILKYGRAEVDRKRLNVKQKIRIAFLWGADAGVDSIADNLGITQVQVIRFLQDERLLDGNA